jgi:hypothetical protein
VPSGCNSTTCPGDGSLRTLHADRRVRRGGTRYRVTRSAAVGPSWLMARSTTASGSRIAAAKASHATSSNSAYGVCPQTALAGAARHPRRRAAGADSA